MCNSLETWHVVPAFDGQGQRRDASSEMAYLSNKKIHLCALIMLGPLNHPNEVVTKAKRQTENVFVKYVPTKPNMGMDSIQVVYLENGGC